MQPESSSSMLNTEWNVSLETAIEVEAQAQAQAICMATGDFRRALETHGVIVELLYREVRTLRIDEGASEVQRIIIARQHLAEARL